MTLLDSLLDAIVRLDGDALVMHVGEKPYVVTTSSAMNAYRGPLAWGQVELSSRILTPDAVLGMVTQILPADQRHALEDLGAIEHEIASPAGVRDRFTVVAARGGDDIWLELRRHPVAAEPAPLEVPQVMADGASTQTTAAAASAESSATAVGLQEPPSPPEAVGPPVAEAADVPTPGAVEPEAIDQPEAAAENVPTIEERVPVIDEVGGHAPEHVEHIVIPVTSAVEPMPGAELDEAVVIQEPELDEALVGEDVHEDVQHEVAASENEPERADAAEFELVEPEAQDAPTEADVDAMLAATASALLSANIEAPQTDLDMPVLDDRSVASPEFLEIVVEDETVISFDEPVAEHEPATEEEPIHLSVEIEAEEAPAPLAAQEPPTEVVPPFAIEEPVVITVLDDAPEPEPESEPEPEAEPVAGLEAAPVAEPKAEPAPAFSATGPEQVSPETAVEHPVSAPFSDPADATTHAAPSPAGVPGGAYEQPRVSEDAQPRVSEDAQPRVSEDAQPRVSEDAQPRIAASVQESSQPARVVVPIGDRGSRPERPGAGARVDDQILQQVLEQAARRGATTVYVVAQSRPMVRVEGEISPLENIPALSAADIERLVATLSPRQGGSTAEGQEWISEVPQVGRVRCVTFTDHRGPGLIFRISSTLTISADHLNLPAEIRELSTQSDGLVIVTGARGSGKSTLVNSFVDLINSTRSDHLITIESEIAFVHESRKSFVSQREVPEDHAVRAAAVVSAVREDPDVLVVEDVQSSDVALAALSAAESGRLVFVSMTAPSSGGAIDGLINMLPSEARSQARAGLASSLRGVVGQVLLRRSAGGRTTARELLLSSPAVAALVRDGRTAELVREQQNGQRFGMMPLAESLSALVRSGAVHPAEAYRRAPDRAALLAALARDGVDTSFAERLA